MTAMPQLVAMFHSLVGLAAVLVAAGALYAPQAFGIAEGNGEIHPGSTIEMSLGLAIGAITFTGSIIAFLKLDGRMSARRSCFLSATSSTSASGRPGRFDRAVYATQSAFFFWLIALDALALGILLIIPIGGADMPVVISMLNSYSGWAAAGIALLSAISR